MTVSWNDRSIAYWMLLQGTSAQETARRFRVNTGAVVEWARLAGMVIRMGAEAASSRSVTQNQRLILDAHIGLFINESVDRATFELAA